MELIEDKEQNKEKPKEQKKDNKKNDKNKKPFHGGQQQKAPDSLSMFKGRQCDIHLRTGAVLRCIIEIVTQYDIIVTLQGMPAVVQKHAIDYTEFPKDDETNFNK